MLLATVLALVVLPDDPGDADAAAGRWASSRSGLRTVRDDAGPISFRHAFTRALVGVVEIWLLFAIPALVCALVSSARQAARRLRGRHLRRARAGADDDPAPADDAPGAGRLGR